MTPSPSQNERFRRIYDANHVAVRDYCFRRLPPADANDAVAEVFLVLWRKIDAAPPDNKALAFLYGIARNIVANSRRSTRRQTRLRAKVAAGPVELTPGHEHQVVQRDDTRRVLGVLDELNPIDQEILRLKAWEQLSNGDIAEVTGLSLRAVETRLSRARKELSRRLEASETSTLGSGRRPPGERGEL